jgi:cytochrome c oxidase subunit 4
VESRPHIPYAQYITIWFALVLLTGVTITVAGLQLGQASIVAAILIATVKGTLVLRHFMHLKHETALFKIVLMVALLTLTVILVLTFVDTSFR